MKNRNIITGITGLLLAISCLPFFVAADFTSGKWAFARDIVTQDAGAADEYVTVELDGTIYEHAQTSFHDLRVVDDQNKETAAVLISQPTDDGKLIPAKIINHEFKGGYSIYTVDCGADAKYNGVDIFTTSVNFSRRVKIEGSSDGVWRSLQDEGYVMDFSHGKKISSSKIYIEEAHYRYLRITIFEQKEAPIVVTNISLLPSTNYARRNIEIPVKILSVVEDKNLKATVIILKLPNLKMPSSDLYFQTGSTNFNRYVEIESTNDSPDKAEVRWQFADAGNVYDMTLSNMNMRAVFLDYKETRAGFLRVKIFNQDDQPLKIQGVSVHMQPWYLLFKREASRSYRLFYGNEKAVAPQYDLAQLVAHLKIAKLPRLKLSQEVKLVATLALEPVNSTPNSLLSSLVLLVAAVVLGALIYRLAKMNATN